MKKQCDSIMSIRISIKVYFGYNCQRTNGTPVNTKFFNLKKNRNEEIFYGYRFRNGVFYVR